MREITEKAAGNNTLLTIVAPLSFSRQAEEKARLERETQTKLTVANLPAAITEDEHLRIAFEPFGRVRDLVGVMRIFYAFA